MYTVNPPERSARQIIGGSWFECFLYRLSDEPTVLKEVKRHRDNLLLPQYKCAAYILDAGRIERFDGDGDPADGKPML